MSIEHYIFHRSLLLNWLWYLAKKNGFGAKKLVSFNQILVVFSMFLSIMFSV